MNFMEVPFQWISLERKLISEELRLNASSYSFDAIRGRNLIESIGKKLELSKIENFTEKIFVGSRVKRLFTNEENGIPYLMPIDLFMFHLKPRKWVKKETQDLENWWVKPLTVLITQSGTPGRCLIVNKHFTDKVVSPNVVRVVPSAEGTNLIGFIYAFLNTWIGQAFLTKTQYGETVKHIEPYHVGNIPLPLLPEHEIKEINRKILEAHKLREEAQELLLKAEELFYEELELPLLNDDVINYFSGQNGRMVKAFTLNSNEFYITQIRLNAYSYLPISRYATKILRERSKGKYDLKKLGDPEVSQKIFTPQRFKRTYVKNEGLGIPFLGGSNVPLLKWFDIKHISKKTEKLCDYLIKKNWVLITRSGTVGRVCLVTSICDNWAASEHITRIIPSDVINVGYLTIFLLSQYGSLQLQPLVYGGVVEEIGEAISLITEILVPIPSDSTQEKIGNLVIEAYEKKDQANMLENDAVKSLEEKLVEAAK